MHQLLGHVNEQATKATAKYLGYEIKSQMETCDHCAIGKAKQKNLKKVNPKKSKIKGERFYMDISSVKSQSVGGAKYWALLEDEATEMCWSLFLRSKS